MIPMYTYKAKCVRVVDGDTFDLLVDLGFRLTTETRFRLHGVNCPELHSKDPEQRKLAADATLVSVDCLVKDPNGQEWPLTVRTYKDPDSFGRWLAKVELPDGRNFGDVLLEKGLAVPFVKK